MKSVLACVAISVLAGGCGGGCNKKKPEEAPMPKPAAPAPAGSGSAAAPKPITADDLSKRFEQCWTFFNNAKWDDFKACYADNATFDVPGSPLPPITGNAGILDNAKKFAATFPDMRGEPQLELISGHTVVGISLLTGTMTGDLTAPMAIPATKNKVGLLLGQVVTLDDQARATSESEFYDLATLLGQIKPDPKHPVRAVADKALPKEIVIATDSEQEKANLATTQKIMEAFSAHDAKAFGEFLADDVTWSEAANAKDTGRKETIVNAQAFWKGFSDAKLKADKQWAAQNYVATVGELDATNDGDLPAMGIKKTGKAIRVPFLAIAKLDGGKVKRFWLFDQSIAFATQLGLMPPPAAPPVPAPPAPAPPAPAK
jgi:ketosteroid isomerase-like protein